MRPEDALARLPVPARRVAYRAAYRALTVWRLVRRPRTEGVKCVLRHERRVLFIRHTYGDREVWELPGGGIRRGEPPLDAARREALEELGVDVSWRPLGTIEPRDRRTNTLHVFVADAASVAVTLDAGEIAEARWASPHEPPRPLSPSAAAAILALPGAEPG